MFNLGVNSQDADDPHKPRPSLTLRAALTQTAETVTRVINNAPKMNVHDAIAAELPATFTATLTEKEWRLIRFALWTAARMEIG